MSSPPPRPDYIGPREGAQGFLERETNADPVTIARWLSLAASAGDEWPYPNPRHPAAWIEFRPDERFSIRLHPA